MDNFINPFTIIILGIIGVIVLLIASNSIKIVRDYQRLVVFRLGKSMGERGPGLIILIPFIDKPVWVDQREQYIEVPSQTCITKDNAPISIDFLIYTKVVDPEKSVIQVSNYIGAAQGIAMTTLRAVVGDIMLDEVLARREQINHVLRAKLDEVTERWGVKVTTVEIREIQPPKDVQDAMTRQMSAERTRRALVTEADGKKQATITIAEGDKQSAILRAEGDKQSAILRAEGYSMALQKIFEIAQGIDANTMNLQYLDTLKNLGASPSTKFVFPMEFMNLIKPFTDHAKEATKPTN
ncbi:SPFH/Band 7/PHB domain protein [bacterium]|nr:SPFH/Band 7/PHB domain protein [bacterium]